MLPDCYFGAYARFDTTSKKDAAILLGSNCIIGDVFNIEFKPLKGQTRAWVVNDYGDTLGYLDEQTSHKLNLLAAKNWEMHAVLSFVAFTDQPEPGFYWGEVAIFCYDKVHQSDFDTFMRTTMKLLAQGIRPRIDIKNQGVQSILDSHGTWQPSQRADMPKGDSHTAILKKSRGFTDLMVQKSREGNKGCFLISWAFLLALVALVVFGLKSCGLF